uniref:SFRICE_020930 n=1 Tax=Spodoptera frugiperda TaxID=7108 RepID=A0A2H1VAL6_SPOFR
MYKRMAQRFKTPFKSADSKLPTAIYSHNINSKNSIFLTPMDTRNTSGLIGALPLASLLKEYALFVGPHILFMMVTRACSYHHRWGPAGLMPTRSYELLSSSDNLGSGSKSKRKNRSLKWESHAWPRMSQLDWNNTTASQKTNVKQHLRCSSTFYEIPVKSIKTPIFSPQIDYSPFINLQSLLYVEAVKFYQSSGSKDSSRYGVQMEPGRVDARSRAADNLSSYQGSGSKQDSITPSGQNTPKPGQKI